MASGLLGGLLTGVGRGLVEDALTKRQMALEELRAQREDARETAKAQSRVETISQAVGGLPEDQRRLALAFPDQFASAYSKTLFPEAQKPEVRTVGNDVVMVGPDGKATKLYSAPFSPKEPDQTLVEVYDPASPTGTRMVPRSQAAGQPGKPSSGMRISYDADGRPIIETGVRGGQGGEKPPAGYRATEGGNLEAIPGGPADKLSAEAQGRASLLPGGLEDLAAVKEMLIAPDGSVNRSVLATAATGLPFSQGREFVSRMMSAADTINRIRTGAAMTPSEMEQALQMYSPSPLDSEETIKNKLARLERDLESAYQEYTRGTSRDPQKAKDQPKPATITSDEDYERLPSGTPFIGPDGVLRVKP